MCPSSHEKLTMHIAAQRISADMGCVPFPSRPLRETMKVGGRCAMRNGTPVLHLALVLLLVGGACAGCSDSFWDPGGIEFHLDGPQEVTQPRSDEVITFIASGAPVDDGDMCEGGVVVVDRLESDDGVAVTLDDWAASFSAAQAEGGTIEVYSFQEFECSDGSGTFSMKVRTTFDFADFEFEGEQDVGRWEIESGTGEYTDLGGSGDVTLDYDNDDVEYGGDVR
jgi:hypothetical protein